MSDLRMTLQTQLVLRALLEEPTTPRYGLELCDLVGLPSGTIYPILSRLERATWLESFWEDAQQHVAERRPRRRYYRLTPDGAVQARQALAESYRARSRPVLGWVPLPGPLSGT